MTKPKTKTAAATTTSHHKPKASLVGKWFHSIDEHNCVKWQGNVLSEPSPGTYLVQLYSWIMGEPSEQRLVTLSEMSNWYLHDDNRSMTLDYDRRLKYPTRL